MPMHQEGGIILGTGGDNSNRNMGTFFEGVMVSGYPTDAAENAVQANVVSVGYSGETNVPNGPQGHIIGPGGQCVDVAADDTGVNLAPVQLWNCQSYAEDQFWTHHTNGSLSTIGRCLDISGNGTANGSQVELWDCNGVGRPGVQPALRRLTLQPAVGPLPGLPRTGPRPTERGCGSGTATAVAAQKFTLN